MPLLRPLDRSVPPLASFPMMRAKNQIRYEQFGPLPDSFGVFWRPKPNIQQSIVVIVRWEAGGDGHGSNIWQWANICILSGVEIAAGAGDGGEQKDATILSSKRGWKVRGERF